MEINILKSKWWYRLIKVIYIVIFSFAIIGVLFGSIDELKPKSLFVSTESLITCKETGSVYIAADLNIFSDIISSSDDSNIRKHCLPTSYVSTKRGTTLSLEEFAKMQKTQVLASDYELQKKYIHDGTWPQMIILSILAVLFVVILFELARRIFFYIITGKFIKLK